MGYFNINYDQFKPSSNTGVKKQTVSDKLQQNLKKFDAPTPTQQLTVQQPTQFTPEYKPSFGERISNFFNKPVTKKVVDTLNYPSWKVEQLLTGGEGYSKKLDKIGIKNTEGKLDWNDAASFAGQMILDPLNLIPVGKLGKLAGKGVSKVDDVTKVSKALSKVDDVTRFSKLRSAVGTKFIRGYGLPEVYNTLKSEIPTKLGLGAEKVVGDVADVFSKYGDLSDEARDAVAKFLEPKFAGAGEDLGELRRSLEASGEWSKIKPMLTESRKILNNEVVDLVQRGRMTGDVAKDLLTRGGYFPHTDFASKNIQKYFGKGREVGERAWYLKKRKGAQGFTFNAPKAIAKRELAQFQNNVVQDFLKTVKESLGYKMGSGNKLKEGFYWFDEKTPETLIELKGWAVPQKVADDLLALHGETGIIARTIDRFNRAWKPTATAVNPSFHFMNIMGNAFNSWIGGMKDPRRFLQAVAGNFNEGEKAILEGSGILARGQFGADLVNKAFSDVDSARLLSVFDAPIARNLRKYSPRQVGEFFENNARSAFFLNAREKFIAKGLDDVAASRKAIAETNKYLFDYLAGLTPFETNVMRRVFPFYTWARFNIPLQLQSLVTQPQKYAAVTKIYRELNKGYDISEDEEGLGFPTPFVDANGDPIRWVPNLPVNDIFSLNRSRFANMINPVIKDAGQLGYWAAFGQPPVDTYTGRPRTNKNLPVGEQVKDIFDPRRSSSLPQSLLRPVRSLSQFGDPNRETESILDFIIGGFYVSNSERAQMRELYEKEGLNSAVRYKIRETQNNPRLTVEEKQGEVRRLLRLME